MIGKKSCYCTIEKQEVEGIVEEISKGRGKKAEVIYNFLNCNNSGSCDKTKFCKFVNPLTVRNPLELTREKKLAKAG